MPFLFHSSRRPAARDGLVVLQSDGRTLHALATARGRDDVHVLAWTRTEAPLTARSLAGLVHELDTTQRSALLVTVEARPELCYLSPCTVADRPARPALDDGLARGWVRSSPRAGADEARELCASIPTAAVRRWQTLTAAAGLELEGVYPLLGAPLAGLAAELAHHARLVLQLERDRYALMEAVGESCRQLDVVHEPPTVRGCAALIGEACPEVVLCGGGLDLGAFGYDLVLAGGTWARIPPTAGYGPPPPRSLAAAIGAARHAFGLASRDATACIPCRPLSTEDPRIAR